MLKVHSHTLVFPEAVPPATPIMKGLLARRCDMVRLYLYVPDEGPGSTSTSKGVCSTACVGTRLVTLELLPTCLNVQKHWQNPAWLGFTAQRCRGLMPRKAKLGIFYECSSTCPYTAICARSNKQSNYHLQ